VTTGPAFRRNPAVSYLMRTLALEGIVAISTNYRIGQPAEDLTNDCAQAFRWTRDNVG
jgi:hypothetical protein